MKNILLLQRKYTDNLGDVAIGKSMCRLLERHNCKVHHHEFSSLSKTNVIYKSNRTDKNTPGVKHFFSSKNIPSALQKYYWLFRHRVLFKDVVSHHFDKVVIGGGELVQCGNFSFALYWWVRLLKFFHKNTDIYLFSVGVFDQWTSRDQKMVSSALKKIKCIYVRDEKSAENLKVYFNLQSKVIPDSVFVNPIEEGVRNNTVLYGITPFSRFLWHDKIALYKEKGIYYENCYNDIVAYLESGKEVVLFYSTKDDLDSCLSFNQFCHENYGVSFPLASISSLDDLVNVIKNSGIVVSARMHACILAVLFSKEVHPIVLSEKMRSFVKRYMNLKENEYREFIVQLNSSVTEILES